MRDPMQSELKGEGHRGHREPRLEGGAAIQSGLQPAVRFRRILSGLERHFLLLIGCRQCANTSSWRTNAPERLTRGCPPFALGRAATHREADRYPQRQDQKDR